MRVHSLLSFNSHSIVLAVVATSFFAFSLLRLYANHHLYRSATENVVLSEEIDELTGKEDHPINDLIINAHAQWRSLLEKEPLTLAAAADQYRSRRGRHPPPGFAEWFEFAKSRNAIIVEDFFDQIHHDLNPFWGIAPRELRRRTKGHEPRIEIRNHQAKTIGDGPWSESWLSLVKSVENYLPDVDMPVNPMDESRMVVPWGTVNSLVDAEQSSRGLTDPGQTVTEYMRLLDELGEDRFEPRFLGPADSSVWEMIRIGCPPSSPSRDSFIPHIDFANPPPDMDNYLRLSHKGYVKNWTQTMDPCIRPELQALHGGFVEPQSVSTTHEIFPLFGGSKLPMNNEILIPPAMYWVANSIWSSDEDKHGDDNWESKRNVFLWRGAATGGRNREENWTGFQRHRLLAMLNGTSVQAAEPSRHHVNFRLPDYNYYNLNTGKEGRLPDFLEEHADTGFVHLVCFPGTGDPYCPYTDPYFAVTPGIPMAEQYAYKYLLDIDGNSFSGRYRSFLGSTSLPIKSTIYKEWHDSRIIPWAHFVPMDPTSMDIYGIMEYFIGDGRDRQGHDAVARKMAFDGKAWTKKVLRREDMQIYVYRLLLEYARICDDRRDMLGYAQDRFEGESG